MGLKVEFSSQRFIELLIKLSIAELLNFSNCSRRVAELLVQSYYAYHH